eukprot:UN08957
MRDFRKAESDLRTAIKMSEGRNLDAIYELCRILVELEDHNIREAVDYLNELKLENDFDQLDNVYFLLSFCHERLKENEKAFFVADELVKLRPNNPIAFYDASRFAQKIKRYDMAEKYAKECLRLDPSNNLIKYHLALSQYKLNKVTDNTMKILEELLKKRTK